MSIAGIGALGVLYLLGIAGFILAYDARQSDNLGDCLVHSLAALTNHLFVVWAIIEVT